MKNFLLLLSFVLIAFVSNSQIILYEGFEYPVGDSLPQHNWLGVNSGDEILVTTGSLTYSGLAPSLGNKISFDGGGRDFQRIITPLTSGTVFLSFIIQVTDITSLDTNGGYFTGFGASQTLFGSSIWIKKSGTGFNIGVNPRSSTANTVWDGLVYNINTPLYIVVSYELVAGTNNDIASIWINPSSASFESATAPVSNITITNTGTDLTSVDRFFVRQNNTATTPFIDLDEFRIGTTWASVTPTITAIKDNYYVNNISIFPNPVTDFVTITAKENISQVHIYDIQGKKIIEYDFNGSSEIRLNVAGLPKGLYNIVSYSTKGNIFCSKLEK